jgi:hypothetical protein
MGPSGHMLDSARQADADTQAHTRSHPSAFLTTKSAAPRLFPFPLGKTSVRATVKDELWWEGGNAPHVVSRRLRLRCSAVPPVPYSLHIAVLIPTGPL